MNKQELTQALEKAKRQLSLAKEQDEKDFAEKKIAKLEKELSEMEEKPKEEAKKKDEPKEKPKAEPKAKAEPKPKQDKPKAKSETVADKLMAIDGDVWDELNIKSGSQLYADLKLQEKYKKALNNAIMDDAEKISLPLSQGVFDALEDDNYHSLNQHLTLMGMFGAKKRTDWLDFLSKNDTKSVLDKSIYEKVSGKPKPKTRSGDDDEDYCHELIEREEGAKKSGYDLDELLRSAKERKAKSKKRAQDRKDAPKKTPATKDRERVSKTNEAVVKGVMKRAEQGKVTAIEVEKLIAEHEEAIEDLQKVLAKLKAKKMRRGGGVDENKITEQSFNKYSEFDFYTDDEGDVIRITSNDKELLDNIEKDYSDRISHREYNEWIEVYKTNGVPNVKKRLEELRQEIRNENISYGEIAELQSLVKYIDESDVELLEVAGVDEQDLAQYGKPIAICNRTGSFVYPTEVEGYYGYCPELDEDVYQIETTPLMRRGGGVGSPTNKEVFDNGEVTDSWASDIGGSNESEDFVIIYRGESYLVSIDNETQEVIRPRAVASVYEMRRGGRTTGTDKKRDAMFDAKESGKRKSSNIAYIDMKSGGYYQRNNANQYYNDKDGIKGKRSKIGERTYYESAKNRSDKGKWK